jgi:hypothetical protein
MVLLSANTVTEEQHGLGIEHRDRFGSGLISTDTGNGVRGGVGKAADVRRRWCRRRRRARRGGWRKGRRQSPRPLASATGSAGARRGVGQPWRAEAGQRLNWGSALQVRDDVGRRANSVEVDRDDGPF